MRADVPARVLPGMESFAASLDYEPVPTDPLKPARPKPVYRDMTESERTACLLLAGIVFGYATPDKRFARQMNTEAQKELPRIAESQADYLWRVIHRYRKQIPMQVKLLEIAKRYAKSEGK